MFFSVCVPSFFFSPFVLPAPSILKTDRYHTTNTVSPSAGAGFDCRISGTCGKILDSVQIAFSNSYRNKDKSYGLFIPLVHGDDREQTKPALGQAQIPR